MHIPNPENSAVPPPPPARTRTYADCRAMTPKQKREHRRAQNRASYARSMADPARRAALADYSREYSRRKYGTQPKPDLSALTPEQRHARTLAMARDARARRLAADPARQAMLRARETAPARVAYKGEWQRAHAADLNARRRADRQANPAKYHAYDRAAKQRRRAKKQGR